MKKIIYMGLCLAAATSFSACSDDDAGSSYLRENTVGVISSNLYFDANAQQGAVKFTAPAGAVATVSQSWATAEVKGDSVVVSVTNNPALESRAAVLTIKSGIDSTNVPVLQAGGVFTYKGATSYVVSDADTTLLLPFSKVGAEPKLTAAGGDAVTSIEERDSAFAVSIKPNTTGEMRVMTFYLKNQGVTDTITVKQGELKDFLDKTYYLAGYDLMKWDENTVSIDDVFVQLEGTVTKKNGKIIYSAPADGIRQLPLTFDASTLTFRMAGGSLVGTVLRNNVPNYLLNSIWDSELYMFFSDLTYQYYMDYMNGNITDDEMKKFQQMMPVVFGLFDTNKLSMLAPMDVDASTGYVYGSFVDSGENDWMAARWKNLGYTGTTYHADMLCIDAFVLGSESLDFEEPLMQILNPMIFHIPASSQGGAKALRSMCKVPAAQASTLRQSALKRNKVAASLRK